MSSRGWRRGSRTGCGSSAFRPPSAPRRRRARLGIPIATFAEYQTLDLTIDGADEVELGTLNLIKGLGGALLREKIVAAASRRLVIVVDQEKLVDRLGEHTPVPVEVTQFGWQATAAALAALGCIPERRYTPASSRLSPMAAISSSIAGSGRSPIRRRSKSASR